MVNGFRTGVRFSSPPPNVTLNPIRFGFGVIFSFQLDRKQHLFRCIFNWISHCKRDKSNFIR